MLTDWQTLLGICIPYAVQMASFAVIAWFCIKKRGGFPFELAGCFACGAIVLSKTAEVRSLPYLIPFVLGAVSALSIERLSAHASNRIGMNRDVFGMIVALSALVVFDFFTESSPVSILYPGSDLLITALVLVAIITFLMCHIVSGAHGARLRLGEPYRWAAVAWLRQSSASDITVVGVSLLSWSLVLAIPMSTTGVATQTIFRDTTLAILIAKAITIRHPLWLPVIAVLVAAGRIATAYTLAGPFGTLAGDISVMLILSFIVGTRVKHRTT